MKCDEIEIKVSAYADGELSAEEQQSVERHLEGCPACREELERHRRVGAEVEKLVFSGPQDELMDRYEGHLYARMERGFGWILLSLGAILLAGAGAWLLVQEVLLNPEIPLIVRVGVGTGTLGLVILAVGALRQRLFTYKRDKYTGVER